MSETAVMTDKEKFLESFVVPANRHKYFDTLAKEALKALETLDFPTTKNEDWKYTRTGKISGKSFVSQQNNEKIDIAPFIISGLQAKVLVFVNGFFRKDLSDKIEDTGLIACSMNEAAEKHPDLIKNYFSKNTNNSKDIFAALNAAYFVDGVFVCVGGVVNQPIHILYIAAGNNSTSQVRNLFVAKKNSSCTLLQSFVSIADETTFTNCVTEVVTEESSNFEIIKLQQESSKSFQISTEQVSQHNNSIFNIHTNTFSGALVRNNLNIAVDGTNCETHLNGIYILKDQQHVDNHTVVDHKQPHCQSNELYKGVLDGKSTGVFNGKVFVRPDAQKINAFQSNANILLSDHATMNSKPELEIYADDVKCSHGSTTGQLDDEALFYLRSRGLSEDSARSLLVFAFAGEVIEKIKNENIKSHLIKLLEERIKI